jgi:hypothetical protein
MQLLILNSENVWNMWPVKYLVHGMESCRLEIGVGGVVFTTTMGGFLDSNSK